MSKEVKEKVVIEYNEIGHCVVDVDLVVKKWNHLWFLSQWKRNYKLVKAARKDSQILSIKVQISNDQAHEIISRIKLVRTQSTAFRSGGSWKTPN